MIRQLDLPSSQFVNFLPEALASLVTITAPRRAGSANTFLVNIRIELLL